MEFLWGEQGRRPPHTPSPWGGGGFEDSYPGEDAVGAGACSPSSECTHPPFPPARELPAYSHMIFILWLMRAGVSEKKWDPTDSDSGKKCFLAGGFQAGPQQERAHSKAITAWSLRESLLNKVGQGLGEPAGGGEAVGKPPHPRKV